MGIIAGIYKRQDEKVARADLAEMLSAQIHRDPKGTVVSFVASNVAVGGINQFDERSLSKVQKSVYAFVDGIVLESNGAGLSSMVVSAYEEWGLDFVNHLEGEFSCCIWDKQHSRLVLARDIFGHKPLHYYVKDQNLYFSSEIKGLLAAGVPAELDLVSFSDYLTLNCIPGPDHRRLI